MAAPQSTPLPPAPQRNEPEDVFIPKSNAWVAAQEQLRTELQAQADFVNDSAVAVAVGVGEASDSATSASNSEINAAQSAADASNTFDTKILIDPLVASKVSTENIDQSINGNKTFVNGISVNGLSIGKGGGQVASNSVIGKQAMEINTIGDFNTANGTRVLQNNTEGNGNTAGGHESLKSNTVGGQNTANGIQSMYANTIGVQNTASGQLSLSGNIDGDQNTAMGKEALSNNVSFNNCSGIGLQSQTTSSNQVQLGNSATTTYTYGAVQNRSDIRDKAEIRDTVLGLDFIDSLRPVDFKWDMREDYRSDAPAFEDFESDLDYRQANDEWIKSSRLSNITHDGTHTRARWHHGLIAQELKSIITNSGVEFGGFQDHKIGGGDDVLSIGYEELIAPLIKAVQQLSAKIKDLET